MDQKRLEELMKNVDRIIAEGRAIEEAHKNDPAYKTMKLIDEEIERLKQETIRLEREKQKMRALREQMQRDMEDFKKPVKTSKPRKSNKK